MIESPNAYVTPKLEALDAEVVTATGVEEETMVEVELVEAEDEA